MTKLLLSILDLFDITLRIKGFPIQEAKKRLRETQQIPDSDYADHISEAKAGILQHHLENNSFYKKFIGKQEISNWEDIPILRKKDLQIPLVERLSDNFRKAMVYKGKTSGSSGTPLQYAKDKFCHALTWAVIMDRFGWYGLDFNQSFQARFYGIPLSFMKYQKERLKDKLSHRFRFPIFDLSDDKLAEFLNVFRKKKFDYINGHTSTIVLFAKYLKQQNIVLTEVCPTLTHCVATSEMLFPDDKTLLREQLGVPIINEYGASELDLLAFTNLSGDLQLTSESIFVEIVDNTGKAVPNGTPGNIVITSLYNHAHPFIRYEVGDLGILDQSSTAKKPILKELLGRANDNAILVNGTTVPGHTFYYVAKSAMGNHTVVKEFTIEQHTLKLFTLTYVASRELNTSEKTALKKSFNTYLKTEIDLKFKRVDVLDRSSRGKLKQFISHLS